MTQVQHSTLTGTSLHEPKGVAAATSGKVYISDGAGSGAWTTLTTPSTGKIIQQVRTNYATSTVLYTTFPLDDTIPQKTEGTEIITLSITPTSATSILLIESLVHAGSDGPIMISALFQDTTSNALAVAGASFNSDYSITSAPLKHYMVAGTTSATTFKIRVGMTVAGGSSLRVNGNIHENTRIFGGVLKSTLIITEIEP